MTESVDGTVVIPLPVGEVSATATIVDDQVVAFEGVSFSLGNSLELVPLSEADFGANAPHINANQANSFYGFGGNIEYTAMAWARIDSNVADNFIFGNIGTGNQNSLHLGSRNGAYHSGHWGDDLQAPEAPALVTNEWHHVAFTNTADGAQAIYLDGELASTPISSAAAGNRPTSGYDVVIGTTGFDGGTGSYIGGLDQVRVFNGLLTPEQIFAEVTNGLIPLVSPTLLSSTIVENETLVITINDFVSDVANSTVDPTNLALTVDGAPVTITSAANIGGVTTVNYDIPEGTLPLPLDTLSFMIQGMTVEGEAFDFSGIQTVAALPNVFPGAVAASPDFWIVDEYRAAEITAAGIALPSEVTGIDGHRAMVDLISSGTPPTATNEVPVIAFTDPDAPGDEGIFNRDVAFATDTAGIDDDDIVIYARTQFIVDGPTTETFSIQADDAFAFRVTNQSGVDDPEFVSITGAPVNFLDQSDPTTIYTIGITPNTDTRAVINFPADGTYQIELLYREVTGAAFVEVGSAEGDFTFVADTTTWELVGDPDSILVPPGGSRFVVAESAFPAVPEDGSWNTTWYYEAATPAGGLITNLATGLEFLAGIDADIPSTFSSGPVNANFGFINFQQGNANGGSFGDNVVPPAAPDAVDNSIMLARTQFTVGTAGDFTFNVVTDDGFILRFADPDLAFTSGSGAGSLIPAAPNEIFMDGVANPFRGVINLPEGTHELQLIFVENLGTLSAEVSFAAGAFSTAIPAADLTQVGIFIAPPELPFGVTDISLSETQVNITFAPTDENIIYDVEVSTDLINFSVIDDEGFFGDLDSTETILPLDQSDINDALGVEETPDRVFIRVLETTR